MAKKHGNSTKLGEPRPAAVFYFYLLFFFSVFNWMGKWNLSLNVQDLVDLNKSEHNHVKKLKFASNKITLICSNYNICIFWRLSDSSKSPKNHAIFPLHHAATLSLMRFPPISFKCMVQKPFAIVLVARASTHLPVSWTPIYGISFCGSTSLK